MYLQTLPWWVARESNPVLSVKSRLHRHLCLQPRCFSYFDRKLESEIVVSENWKLFVSGFDADLVGWVRFELTVPSLRAKCNAVMLPTQMNFDL